MSAGGRPGTTVTFGHRLAVVNVNVNGAYVPYTRRREARAQPRARSQSITIGGVRRAGRLRGARPRPLRADTREGETETIGRDNYSS
jgi:hypothetical protein